MKTQQIRLLDVFVLGPLMIRAGWLEKDRLIGRIMLFAGGATIAYNYQNYLEEQRRKAAVVAAGK